MRTVTSKDGTKIAYNEAGCGLGPLIILVAGALDTRSSWSKLSGLLAPHFTVVSYDRRGRGDSTDTPPYSPEREIEDIEALIDQEGGAAYIYGHSSGGALALEAALKLGKKVKKLAVYEVPYIVEDSARKEAAEYEKQLTKLLSEGNKGDAVVLFLRRLRMSEDQIKDMRRAPTWPAFESLAPTLAYENAVMGEGFRMPKERLEKIAVPTLVMDGGAGLAFVHEAAQALKSTIPGAQRLTLKDQTHNVMAEVIAPVLIEFFSPPLAKGIYW